MLPMFVSMSALREKTKLVGAFLAKLVPLINIDLLSIQSVLDAGGLVVAKSDGSSKTDDKHLITFGRYGPKN